MSSVPGLERIEADALACERGGRMIFRNVSLMVRAGEAVSLEGANGAGKTSLLRMLAGFIAPAAGRILFHRQGAPVEDGEERGRHVGWLGHLDGVKAQLSVSENIRYAAALFGAADDAGAVLDRVGLKRIADLPGQYLSAGQRRRLALARLILSRRSLWLMDEPLAALDASGKRLAAELVTAHCAQGGMVIAATHDPLGVDATRFTMGAA
jgi:heme exporter protein A